MLELSTKLSGDSEKQEINNIFGDNVELNAFVCLIH